MARNNGNIVNMTEGDPKRLILWFTLPMILGNLFQQFYNWVDCIIVDKFVGDDALAAVGATSSVNFFFFAISNGIGTGVGIVVAQFFGAKRDEDVRRTIANSVYVVGAVGLLMSTLAILLARPLLTFLDTPDKCLEMSITYMMITCGCSLAVVGYNTISGLLRALGDSKTPLIFLVISCVINIGLDLLFIIRFHMGVAGAAWATVISQGFSCIGSIICAKCRNPYFRIARTHRTPQFDIIRRCFAIGVPIAFMSSTISISCIALQKVVNGFGEKVVAANTAIVKIEQIIQQPCASLGNALSAYAGQNLGARKTERIRKGFRVGLEAVIIFSAVMFVIPKVLGRYIIGIFVEDPEAIAMGTKGLIISSCFYVMLGLIYIARGTLNGIGDNRYAMLNGFTELLCRVGLAWPLTHLTGLGKWGIWVTTSLTWTITGVMSIIRYRRKMRKVSYDLSGAETI